MSWCSKGITFVVYIIFNVLIFFLLRLNVFYITHVCTKGSLAYYKLNSKYKIIIGHEESCNICHKEIKVVLTNLDSIYDNTQGLVVRGEFLLLLPAII